MILLGGLATRLRPLSCTRPKALFPILNKPLLKWTFERLAKNDIREVILAANYQTEAFIKQHKLPKNELRITYSRDPPKKQLGTGGPIKQAEKLIGHDKSFMVLNGDIFADINYRKISKIHEEKKAIATIALHTAKDPSRYGVAELTAENQIKRFIEKPPKKDAPTNLINAGIYVLDRKIFKYIPKGQKVSLEREIFPKLVEEHGLYGYVFDGLWIDIGKPQEYLEINKSLLKSFTNSKEYNVRNKGKILKPVAFDKGVSIGEKSVVGPYAVLGQNVIVGNGVRIKNSVIFPNATISDFVSIDGAIIGEGVNIGKNVKINRGCLLGDHVKIKDNIKLASGVSVCPAKEIHQSILKSKYII